MCLSRGMVICGEGVVVANGKEGVGGRKFHSPVYGKIKLLYWYFVLYYHASVMAF